MTDSRFILTIFVIAALIFFNCNGPQKAGETSTADSSGIPESNTGSMADSIDACFLNTNGGTHPDSAYLHLTIHNGRVSGSYESVPYEKDARRGMVKGTKTGDIYDLNWTFMQEGMRDTLRVVFKIDGQNLLQKPLSVDTQTGRQVTRDSSQFTIQYLKVACK